MHYGPLEAFQKFLSVQLLHNNPFTIVHLDLPLIYILQHKQYDCGFQYNGHDKYAT